LVKFGFSRSTEHSRNQLTAAVWPGVQRLISVSDGLHQIDGGPESTAFNRSASAKEGRQLAISLLLSVARLQVATDSKMKTWKSEHDLLLDQTLALVKAAIDHDARALLPSASYSSAAQERSLRPMLSDEILVEKTARMEQNPLVDDILSLIEHVSHGATKAIRIAWEAERLKVNDDIGRMASDLDTLRRQVNDFKETQQRFRREREEDAATTTAKAWATQWKSPKP
jgi:hypothetical protein